MMDIGTQTSDEPKDAKNLPDYAANAALYATNADRQSKINKLHADGNNKPSSASAATTLKHANPRDLPSFPSPGLVDKSSSAGVAASLANANQKTLEHWKPEYLSTANRAALLANGYKAPKLWRPESSSAGSKAAQLAASHGANASIQQPDMASDGNPAAGQAIRNKNPNQTTEGYTKEGRSRALLAATGAMSGRQRAGSSPALSSLPSSYPDPANSASNALNAASLAHRPSAKAKSYRQLTTDLPGLSATDANRIHNAAVTNLGREMYTSHPPVAPEVEEKNRKDGIHAAAVVMAKSMYDLAQKKAKPAESYSDSRRAANKVHHGQPSATEDTYRAPAQSANLQEAAQKLAFERLAKLHDEQAAYRNYYGTRAPPQSRLSVRGHLRRRASSDSQLPHSDEARSRQIRSQMSILDSKLDQIDSQKRQRDRDALMAAAQRNVTKSMHGLDEKIFADTGKVSPAMMAEWEAKARARAEAESRIRMANQGKIDIGGGRFMDQSEITAIAAAKVQPTLDDITAKAGAERAKDEARKQEEEERRRFLAEKAQDEKDRNIKAKEQWKLFREEEKRDAKAKKAEEMARKEEEKAKKVADERAGNKMVLDQQKQAQDGQYREEREKEENRKGKSAVPAVGVAALAAANGASDEPPSPMNTPLPATKDTVLGSSAKGIAIKDLTAPVAGGDAIVTGNKGDTPSTPAQGPAPSAVSRTIIPPSTTTTTITGPDAKPPSPKNDQGKVSSWLKSKFRRSSRATKPSEELSTSTDTANPTTAATATITSSERKETAPSAIPLPDLSKEIAGSSAADVVRAEEEVPLSTSMHDVAMAGKEPQSHPGRSRSTSISSLSRDAPTQEALREEPRGRSTQLKRATSASDHLNDEGRTTSPKNSATGRRDMFEEARGMLDPEKLPPPRFPKAGLTGKAGGSPVRDSRFVEIL